MSSEDILREAVIRFHEAELQVLLSNSCLLEKIEVSDDFRARMQKLIKKYQRRVMTRRISQGVMIVFFCMLTGLILLLN
ncbi:MAG: hypothetical protein J1F02_01290 [Lachnospiraceae bacterium]|nr:hypothetical protein [Lachnospiraceae bacterium]